ncbi:hypothetical protein TRFO_14086 [Tritrichomonas foetus]|uniref:Uncharacterized protein n=1 Tax=Tritrichomonas foetus TaxID=1144522 RepID=A0A1J4KWD3_9EUKA|nr:hypothetical protein TRFO_14086 [Tritrichomonas foetus]|eukprot:OHT15466.1 hypothetical protein TRFO_14086 [Tritrichomonas foetus]
MSRHVHELLHLALSTEPEARDALYILCTVNYTKPIIGLILSDSSFTSLASVVIQTPDVSQAVIGRLASLTAVAFVSYPEQAINSCWFLSSFLKFLNNTSVFALFQKLATFDIPKLNNLTNTNFSNNLSNGSLSNFNGNVNFASLTNSKSKSVSSWLKKYGFANDIVNELSKINFNRRVKPDDYYFDEEVQKCNSLYELIIHSSANPILFPTLASEEVIISLSQTFLQAPPFLTGKRWEAIRALTCERTLSLISPLVANAVSQLYTPHSEPLQDVVEPVYFITRTASLSHEISCYLKETQIFQVLLRYVLQFPDATFLHKAFREFVKMSLKNNELCPIAVDIYLQLFISETKIRAYGALTATFWDILLFINKKKGKVDILKVSLKRSRFWKEYRTFEKKYLKKYRKIINSNYGGRIEVINKPRIVD